MKVLIVEDEEKIANSIKKGLMQENFIVDLAYNGTKGHDLASTEDYDVIVLDLMLPGMDGLKICSSLREQDINVPILMLTAKGELEDKVRGLNIGADDYLVKPFAFEELLARIKALGRRPQKKITEVLTANDLNLDVGNLSVIRGNRKINLTRKEFALLEYLLRNKDKVVTKEQIISNVWDYDADILPNTVEVYIGYLRQKVDKGFPKKDRLIHTVRGFGYKIGKEK